MKYLVPFVVILASCSAPLTAGRVMEVFKSQPIRSSQDMRDGQNIGRANGPTSAYAFFDERYDGRVEILAFGNNTLPIERKKMLDEISSGLRGVSDYNFAHKNVLVVVPSEFKPEHAEEYRRLLNAL